MFRASFHWKSEQGRHCSCGFCCLSPHLWFSCDSVDTWDYVWLHWLASKMVDNFHCNNIWFLDSTGMRHAQITPPTQNLLLKICTCTTIWCPLATLHADFLIASCTWKYLVKCRVGSKDETLPKSLYQRRICCWRFAHALPSDALWPLCKLISWLHHVPGCTWSSAGQRMRHCPNHSTNAEFAVEDLHMHYHLMPFGHSACWFLDCIMYLEVLGQVPSWVKGWDIAQVTLPTQNLLLKICTCTTIWCPLATLHADFLIASCTWKCLVKCRVGSKDETLPKSLYQRRICCWRFAHASDAFWPLCMLISWLHHVPGSTWSSAELGQRMRHCPNHSTNAEFAVEDLHMHYHLIPFGHSACWFLDCIMYLEVLGQVPSWVKGWDIAQITLPTQNLLLKICTCTTIWCPLATLHADFLIASCTWKYLVKCRVGSKDETLPKSLYQRRICCWRFAHALPSDALWPLCMLISWLHHVPGSTWSSAELGQRMRHCPNHSTNAEFAVEDLHMHHHSVYAVDVKFCCGIHVAAILFSILELRWLRPMTHALGAEVSLTRGWGVIRSSLKGPDTRHFKPTNLQLVFQTNMIVAIMISAHFGQNAQILCRLNLNSSNLKMWAYRVRVNFWVWHSNHHQTSNEIGFSKKGGRATGLPEHRDGFKSA